MTDFKVTTHLPIFTTSLAADEITPEAAVKYIQLHDRELEHLGKLERYYATQHDILNRKRSDPKLPNNQIVASYPKYIADFSSAYLMGTPVKYSAPEGVDITPLTDTLKKADSPTQDCCLALDGSIFGRSYEMVYVNADAEVKLAKLLPLNAFVVYDQTVEQLPVFAVHYFPTYDDNGCVSGYLGSLCTASYTQEIRLTQSKTLASFGEPVDHYFGKVPINEIYNNDQRFGDFEHIISLIDAYDILQSDRVNDKEQFVDALLVIRGAVLGDDDEESTEAYKALKDQGVMVLPDKDSGAAYLTRQFDESSVEVLKNSIVSDIHKLSYVPDMSDDSFAGNVSGVAMKYKLLMLEAQAKIKERYFAEGLRYRLECIENFLLAAGAAAIDTSQIMMKFERSLPVNMQESAQTASLLTGVVSKQTQIEQLPFVEDVEAELGRIAKEQQEAVKQQAAIQQAMMQKIMNTNIRDTDI